MASTIDPRSDEWFRGLWADLLKALEGTKNVRTLIVCGSREWTDPEPIHVALALLVIHEGCEHPQVVHGGARGADRIAGLTAGALGLARRSVPVDQTLDGDWPAAGRRRNQRMLDLGPDLVLAFKDDAQGWDGVGPAGRGGTEHMCRIALQAGVPVLRWSHEHGWERLDQPGAPGVVFLGEAPGRV